MKYIQIKIFYSLFLTVVVAVATAAQSKRKLKQELYFHEDKNYMAISYDTLGQEYFRWLHENKAVGVYSNQIQFTNKTSYETICTIIYGKVKPSGTMKRELPGNFDGFIIRSTKNYDGSTYTYRAYKFKFKNARLAYNVNSLLSEDISLYRTDSVVMKHTIPPSNYHKYFSGSDRTSSFLYQLSYRMDEMNGRLVFSSKKSVDEGKFINNGETIGSKDTETHTQIYITTDHYPYSNTYYSDREKIVQKFDGKHRIIEEIRYVLNKKKGFPDVFQKISRVQYEYFDPYVEKRTYSCYDKKGKLCKTYTIQIKKSFY